MLRKNIHILYGVGIGILLVTLVGFFNHYWDSPPQESVKMPETALPSTGDPKTAKPLVTPEAPTQPESEATEDTDMAEPSDTETEASEEGFQPEPEPLAESLESLPEPPAQEPPQEDSRGALLKEIFPELDRLLQEGQELASDMQERGMTPENYAEFEAKGKELEAELQGYCRQIAEEFPGAVTFITFQGEEQVYDVDFQVLKDSLDGPVPSELEGYFRYARLREMFGLPDMPPEQLQQMQ